MFYEQKLTIPKNTPIASPVEVDMPVHSGVIQQVTVELPAGCVGLVGVRLLIWERQVWPSNPDSWFTGNDMILTFPEDLELTDAPYTITIQGYNLDDTYQHEPKVRMQILPRERTLKEILKLSALGPSGPITRVGGG